MKTTKPVLDYVESEITEFCNLNCKGCGAFINLITDHRPYEIDEFIKDYKRLAELFSSVEKIRLMGGEPLLNPRLTDYVKACRDIFPEADIRIVTNGLLIPSLDDECLRIIKESDCKFDISNYPPTRKMYPQIKAKLKKCEVEFDLGFPMNYFFRFIRENPTTDPAPAFHNCIIAHCHKLSHGKLSPCTHAHCIGRLNKAYGLNYPETDCVDIYSDITGEQIIQRFNNPHEFCKCCGEGIVPFKWQSNYNIKKSRKSDWLLKDNCINNTFAPMIQTVLKAPAKWLRAEIQKK